MILNDASTVMLHSGSIIDGFILVVMRLFHTVNTLVVSRNLWLILLSKI
jgi:hypothetical protein